MISVALNRSLSRWRETRLIAGGRDGLIAPSDILSVTAVPEFHRTLRETYRLRCDRVGIKTIVRG